MTDGTRTSMLLARTFLVLAAASASCYVAAHPVMVPAGPSATGLEYGTDRPGSDYHSFDLPSARPEDCRDACMNDGRCAAFTFVNPGVQGPHARCWLKNPVPNAGPNQCCVSGVKPVSYAAAPTPAPAPPPPSGGRLELNVDRPGSDYRSFDLPTADPMACRNTCMGEAQCLAFTYVNPGVQGPNARCWLKNAVPNAAPNGCCTSGVK
jgi:hypothetical protein